MSETSDLTAHLIRTFSPSHPFNLLMALSSFGLGYIQYYYCVTLLLREGRSPFPFWMHAFYLAHDSTWSLLCARAAPLYANSPLLWGVASTLALFSAIEAFCMYNAATVPAEREAVFGRLFGNKSPSVMTQILPYAGLVLGAMYAVVWLFISYVGQDGMLQSFSWTNVLMVVGPTDAWLSRRSRQGLSLALAWANLLCVVLTFAPFGMWVRGLPDVFSTRTYYATGVLMVVHAVYLVRVVAGYPPKVRGKDGRTPIW